MLSYTKKHCVSRTKVLRRGGQTGKMLIYAIYNSNNNKLVGKEFFQYVDFCITDNSLNILLFVFIEIKKV